MQLSHSILDQKQNNLATIRNLRKQYVCLTHNSDKMMVEINKSMQQGHRVKKELQI